MRLAFLIFILATAHAVNARSVGAYAPEIAVGEVQPGSEMIVPLYLTSMGGTFNVKIMCKWPMSDFFQTEHKRLDFVPADASEEETCNWMTAPDTIFVSPDQKIDVPGGGVANGKADVILRVPDNAEPGIHAVRYSIIPGASGTGIATSTSILISPDMYISIKIPGEVRRSGEIYFTRAYRTSDNEVLIDFLFQNTGTVTLNLYPGPIKIYNEFGEVVATHTADPALVPPGGQRVFTAHWSSGKKIEDGIYKAKISLKHATDTIVREDEIVVPSEITVERTIAAAPQPAAGAQESADGSGMDTTAAIVIAGALGTYYAYRRANR